MEVFPASVALIIRALVVSARWAGGTRQSTLEEMTAAAGRSRVAELEARVATLEDTVELRDAHIEVLESRLGGKRPRKPYPLMERLRIIWLMEYFQIPQRRLENTLGVSRSSVRRWLKAFEMGSLGRRYEPKEPVNKTPREIAELIWGIFQQNPMWGKERIALALWGLGVFIAASTLRNILRRPRPRRSSPEVAAAEGLEASPRQVVARYPNHVWSVDRTRVWRWGIWPTWVLVAVDHFSRAVMAVVPLEGPNAGWVAGALEEAFLRHGPLRHVITDQQGVFTSEVFAELLRDWDVRPRFGAVGRHGSIAVTGRAILTLKHEWLRRVPVIRGLDHLSQLLDDFSEYYKEWRGHSTIGGAVPSVIHCRAIWERPDRAAKTVSGLIQQRSSPDVRITAFRLAAWSQAGVTGP
jgi:transposase InsO family protein